MIAGGQDLKTVSHPSGSGHYVCDYWFQLVGTSLLVWTTYLCQHGLLKLIKVHMHSGVLRWMDVHSCGVFQ